MLDQNSNCASKCKNLGKSSVFPWNHTLFESRLKVCKNRDDFSLSLRHIKNKDVKILEAGCGLGEVVKYLHDAGYENTYGIEINSDVVAFLNQRYPELKITHGDILQMPYSKNFFDVILSYGVIEHFPEGPSRPLQAMFNVLKPGGIAVITVPSFNLIRKLKFSFRFLYDGIRFLDLRKNNSLRRFCGKKLYPDWYVCRNGKKNGYYVNPQFGHFFEYRFTKKQFEKICTDAGFEILESLPFGDIDGLYHNFGYPFAWLSHDKSEIVVTRAGRVLNFVLSKIPFLHNHMHACVLVKK